MQPKNSIWVLSILMAGTIWGCAAGIIGTTTPAGETKPQKATLSATVKVAADRMATGDGLVLTKGGIEFANHECAGAFASKSVDVVKDGKRMTAYKLISNCSSNNEEHVFGFSDIQYNAFGQRTGYKLQIHCSRTNKTYNIQVSDVMYDASWEVISYKAVIDGKEYTYARQ